MKNSILNKRLLLILVHLGFGVLLFFDVVSKIAALCIILFGIINIIKTNNKKICIVVSSLGGGGAERSSALLSELLYDLGYNIYIVSVLDNIEYYEFYRI